MKSVGFSKLCTNTFSLFNEINDFSLEFVTYIYTLSSIVNSKNKHIVLGELFGRSIL